MYLSRPISDQTKVLIYLTNIKFIDEKKKYLFNKHLFLIILLYLCALKVQKVFHLQGLLTLSKNALFIFVAQACLALDL